MKKYNVAILGATGAVGREMLKVLEERKFPINELILLASKKSAGLNMQFGDKEIEVKEASINSFNNVDIVLSAVSSAKSKELTPYAVEAGAIVIDNSSAFRLDKNVPLIIPEINHEDLYNHHGIIANPNCSTIIALTAINEINKYAKIKRMIVSTYQAVSGAGNKGINELTNQVDAMVNNKDIVIEAFKYQIAFNLIPHIGDFNEDGYTQEELKMQNESRKIFHNKDLKVNCTCVRVPVYRSHSEAITIETEDEISPEKAKELLKNASGVKLVDDIDNNIYPMPLDSSNQDLIYVGRIRRDFSNQNSLSMWCCGDQIRKGAATNAVQIAESLIIYKIV